MKPDLLQFQQHNFRTNSFETSKVNTKSRQEHKYINVTTFTFKSNSGITF